MYLMFIFYQSSELQEILTFDLNAVTRVCLVVGACCY